jgi:hypothetical protein
MCAHALRSGLGAAIGLDPVYPIDNSNHSIASPDHKYGIKGLKRIGAAQALVLE